MGIEWKIWFAISWGGVVDLRIGHSKGGRVGYRVQEVASK